jgi:peptide/nickel transport system substrate-binding protein
MHRRAFLAASAAALATPAIAQPTAQRVLRFVPQANLTALDPIWTTAAVTQNHAYNVFDTLYGVDAQQRPQPQMAEGAEASADGRVWRVRLREGLRFHDGSPVLARDCAASLERWAKRDPMGQLLARVVESWGSADDRTLEVRLTRPFPLFLTAIGKVFAPLPVIMPERLARTDANTQVTEVVGSGPYQWVANEFNPGSRAVYTRFEGYVPRQGAPEWTSGGKVAHFDRIEWQIIPDAATAAGALRNGEVDWWEQPLADLIPSLERTRQIAVEIADPTGYVGIIRFNHLTPPFNNRAIRRAVQMMVTQADHMRAILGDTPGLWRECLSLFPCGTPIETTAGADLMRGPRDPEAIRRALAGANYSGQRVVIINPTDFPTIGPLGQVTADVLRRAGMNVELVETDWGSVIQRRASREPAERGGWNIFHTWWPGLTLANPIVNALTRGQGRDGWFGWYDSPQVERLTTEWLDATDEARRRQLIAEINRTAMEDSATVPLGQFFIRTAYRRNLTGVLQGNAPYQWNVRKTA